MKHWFAVAVAVSSLGLAACNKPAAEDCRKAIQNMQHLLGTDSTNKDIEGDVRMCKGGSSKEAVQCAINATTVDQLKACEFMSSKK